MYIKMSKNLSAKNYEENKNAHERYQNLSKEEKVTIWSRMLQKYLRK